MNATIHTADGNCHEVHGDTDEEEGAQILGATKLGGYYIYWADETLSWWAVDPFDVGRLGRLGRDHYSEWCADTDALELTGLGLGYVSPSDLEAALRRARAAAGLEDDAS